MFDIFYIGKKPNVVPFEKEVASIEEAQQQSRTRYCWVVNTYSDYTGWDFLWEPKPWESHQRHAWASQWQKDSETYLVPKQGYQETNYHTDRTITRLPSDEHWEDTEYGIEEFDYSWHPDPTEPPLIHQFGTQWQLTGGPRYKIPNADTVKYVEYPRAVKTSVEDCWEDSEYEIEDFDYTWHPDARDPLLIHQFGTQWQLTGGPCYKTPDAVNVKYISSPRAVKTSVEDHWEMPEHDIEDFDYTWHPDARDPLLIYQFGTQWQLTGGPCYKTPDAVNVKYISSPRATKISVEDRWEDSEYEIEDFDYTWHPDDRDPDMNYQFGTQWQLTGGPRYKLTDSDTVKYISSPRATKISVEDCWEMPEHDIEDFDYTWHPDDRDPNMNYQFGTQWQLTGGPRYKITDSDTVKYVSSPRATKTSVDDKWQMPEHEIKDFDFTWHPDDRDPAMNYQFGTQWQLTGGPRYKLTDSDTIKYVDQPRATKVSVDDNWEVPATVEDFDYTWHPDDRDPDMLYQFGTQHQKTGGPAYKTTEDSEIKYITQVKARGSRIANQAVVVNHNNDNQVTPDIDVIKKSRYFDNYLDTLKRVAKSLPDDVEFVWILSSLCDYTDFDFTWHPEQWQQGMLHVFQSDGEKFGDTFFMHVSSFKQRMDTVELLDWYDLNFLEVSVPRLPIPWIKHTDDSHVEQVKQCKLVDPLIVFQNDDYVGPLPAVPLWRAKTKTVTPLTTRGTTVIVPRQAIVEVREQLWDYEFIDKTHQTTADKPLDIVFIDNGEVNREENYQHLTSTANTNTIHRVSNIKGRVAAYQAAANVSTTPWFFAVFAKLKVEETFDWSWQPDCLQQSKHYIFHAKNPINGLEYGHMAMIAYNKKLVLENTAPGLDFTLDQQHEVVPILSGQANYADDEFMAWRSAFREVVKLKHSLREDSDVETEYRLRTWLTKGEGSKGEWSMLGSQDAVDYYEEVDGSFDLLKLSYDWAWLNERYLALHSE